MSITFHRGYSIQSSRKDPDLWHVRIKKEILSGSLSAIKQSIDWWCDTASIIDPKEFKTEVKPQQEESTEEEYQGFSIINSSTEEANKWYSMVNGKLVKGSNAAIKKHIDRYIAAKPKEDSSEECYKGVTLLKESKKGDKWYCTYDGKIIRGSKESIMKHIDSHENG